MAKLSQALKAVINAPHTRPTTVPAPGHMGSIYQGIADDAHVRHIGLKAWFSAAVSTRILRTYNLLYVH